MRPGRHTARLCPFLFCSSLAYAVYNQKGNVPGYTEGQGPIVHLVSGAQRVEAAGLDFVFTDGHAIMGFTEFFEDLSQLDRIDWRIMRARYWSDTQTDSDRSRRRQAEFLLRDFLPWDLITEIGVIDRDRKARVEAVLGAVAHRPRVTVRRNWYH